MDQTKIHDQSIDLVHFTFYLIADPNILQIIPIITSDRLFFLRLGFDPYDASLFGDSLTKIGTQLRALLLGRADSRVSTEKTIMYKN